MKTERILHAIPKTISWIPWRSFYWVPQTNEFPGMLQSLADHLHLLHLFILRLLQLEARLHGISFKMTYSMN